MKQNTTVHFSFIIKKAPTQFFRILQKDDYDQHHFMPTSLQNVSIFDTSLFVFSEVAGLKVFSSQVLYIDHVYINNFFVV